MDLVIDRNVWLRGEGEDDSYLLRPEDRKMCCVGIYLKQLGVKDADLEGTRAAEMLECPLPEAARWLVATRTDRDASPAACHLYEVNDVPLVIEDDDLDGHKPDFSTADREAYIAAAFAKQGVTVTFIN